jgi:molybdopterin/thiamine biosynthesis adenylyltransferase
MPAVPGWRDQLAGTKAAYVRELEARGFLQENENTWVGPVTVLTAGGAEQPRKFKLVLPGDFPFSWPLVYLARPPAQYDWHLQPPDGQLCLWRREDTPGRPWETVDGLFARIRLWHEHAPNGWPDDQGDLDLDRFFTRDTQYTLITYGDLSGLVGRRLSRYRCGRGWIHLVPRRPGKQRSGKQQQQQRWAYAADLGTLERPVWDWETTLAAMREADRAEVQALARTGRPGLLLLRYERSGPAGPREAAAVLSVTPRPGTAPELRSTLVAQDTPAARSLRAGPNAARFAKAKVAIIGCGAAGSFLAEMLARSGAGVLALVDPERLMPGNCVRHLAGPEYVPQFKVDAVKAVLAARKLPAVVVPHPDQLNPDLAFLLFTECDLIIDVAADGGATGLLEHLAQVTGSVFIKAALHRDGGIMRVDRFGPGTARERPAPIPSLSTGRPAVREAGCGDPVSSAPPSAVIAAASAACRMAADTLQPARRRRLPDSMVEILIPQPDHPYQSAGVLT